MEIYVRDLDDIDFLFNGGCISHGRLIGHTYKVTDYAVNAFGDESHSIHKLIFDKWVLLKRFDETDNIGVKQFYRSNKEKISIADASVLYSAKDTNGMVVTSSQVLLKICAIHIIQCITTEEYSNQIIISQKNKTNENLKEAPIKKPG